MTTTVETAIYAGLSGVEVESDFFDLGGGVTITRVYSHLMAPFLLAFHEAEPGKPHPAPWKSVSAGLTYDIWAEIRIPETSPPNHEATYGALKAVLFLLRLWVNPAATVPVFSNHSFKELPEIPDSAARLLPYEIMPRLFPLTITPKGVLDDAAADWVRERWQRVIVLSASSQEFALAKDALDQGQFVSNKALMLASLWAALEGLFAPAPAELKFRVSALIASFMEGPGERRAALQKKVAALYDKRSAAAHGKPKHNDDDLLESFHLLRNVLIKIINLGAVPTKETLEAALFGT